MILFTLSMIAACILGIIIGESLGSKRIKKLNNELYHVSMYVKEIERIKHESVNRHLGTLAELLKRNRLLTDRLDDHRKRTAELEQKCRDKQARIDKLSEAHSDRCTCGRFKKISEPVCVICKAKAGVK